MESEVRIIQRNQCDTGEGSTRIRQSKERDDQEHYEREENHHNGGTETSIRNGGCESNDILPSSSSVKRKGKSDQDIESPHPRNTNSQDIPSLHGILMEDICFFTSTAVTGVQEVISGAQDDFQQVYRFFSSLLYRKKKPKKE